MNGLSVALIRDVTCCFNEEIVASVVMSGDICPLVWTANWENYNGALPNTPY